VRHRVEAIEFRRWGWEGWRAPHVDHLTRQTLSRHTELWLVNTLVCPPRESAQCKSGENLSFVFRLRQKQKRTNFAAWHLVAASCPECGSRSTARTGSPATRTEQCQGTALSSLLFFYLSKCFLFVGGKLSA
jgi:hypothetical protein